MTNVYSSHERKETDNKQLYTMEFVSLVLTLAVWMFFRDALVSAIGSVAGHCLALCHGFRRVATECGTQTCVVCVYA